MSKALQEGFIKVLSKFTTQRFWEKIYMLSLREMNFGYGGNFRKSGELDVCKRIKKRFENEAQITIFDVGANVGNYSKELSTLFGSQGKIYSFEPSQKTYAKFLQTTKDCKNIIPNNLGFSDKENNQLLFTDSDGSGIASVYQRNLDHFGIKMNQSEEIKLTTIDSFCAQNKIDRINFLKMDIEGHEFSALQGATRMIEEKKIDYIQFEFGGCNIDSRTYFQDFYYFLKDNYRIYRILEHGLCELPTYKETYEVFITINYLAVRRD